MSMRFILVWIWSSVIALIVYLLTLVPFIPGDLSLSDYFLGVWVTYFFIKYMDEEDN